MSNISVIKDRYTIDDPLYQWDKNQVLKIYGLSLPSIPEIHFSNQAMERAIVRQAEMDAAGVITVTVPNSLLQKPYEISVYVCLYDGKTFESLYKIAVPVKERKKPSDYTFEDTDGEIYSFNELENLFMNTLALSLIRYDEVNTKYEQAVINLTNAIKDYNDAKEIYEIISDSLSESGEALLRKENKATFEEYTMLAANWLDNVYSLENVYPSSDYNIEIYLSGTANDEQIYAFNVAQILGNLDENIFVARNMVPTIDIPIIIKAVKI